MNLQEAKILLDIQSGDDLGSAKVKFRKLMREFHPDAIESPEKKHTRYAQEINEAYQIVIDYLKRQKRGSVGNVWNHEDVADWDADKNIEAFCERNIYAPYHMDLYGLDQAETARASKLYQTVSRGKYYWNPEEEEFRYFIKSIHHASKELLLRVESEVYGYSDFDLSEELSREGLSYQIRLFHYLGLQFIRPMECLRKLAEPKYIDDAGRPVYEFMAYLGAKSGTTIYKNIKKLKKGDSIYPELIKNNCLLVASKNRDPLGTLSMREDELYFCIIPLIKAKRTSVKMIVQEIPSTRRSYPVNVKVRFHLRIDDDRLFENENYTEEINTLLKDYKQSLL